MKVLWFTNTSSLFGKAKGGYNGGGWISSLEELICSDKDIELAVSFFYNGIAEKKVTIDNTQYYPITSYNSKLSKLKHNINYEKYDDVEVGEFLKVVNDFKPDLIHVFGSELSFGLISSHVDVPVILHIQGVLNPYLNAWYPPGTNVFDYWRYLSLSSMLSKLKSLYFFKHNASREQKVLSNCKYFMGRTEWDYAVSKIYSPDSHYFHCDEILRNEFYLTKEWKYHFSGKISILTTISKMDYKGFDLILKTAKILKDIIKVDFEWTVFGVKEYSFWEKKLQIFCKDVNVRLLGVADASLIIDTIYQSDVYFHPSYIDNSPNSLCEAQLIGIPVIATNVGGVSSLISNNETGVLIPSNDPYFAAYKISEVCNNEEISVRLSEKGRSVALERHSKTKIIDSNLKTYRYLIENYSSND